MYKNDFGSRDIKQVKVGNFHGGVDGASNVKPGMVLDVIAAPTGEAPNGMYGYWVMGTKPFLLLHREIEKEL